MAVESTAAPEASRTLALLIVAIHKSDVEFLAAVTARSGDEIGEAETAIFAARDANELDAVVLGGLGIKRTVANE